MDCVLFPAGQWEIKEDHRRSECGAWFKWPAKLQQLLVKVNELTVNLCSKELYSKAELFTSGRAKHEESFKYWVSGMFLDRHFLKTFIVFHLVGHIESDRKSNVMDEKLGLNRQIHMFLNLHTFGQLLWSVSHLFTLCLSVCLVQLHMFDIGCYPCQNEAACII